MDLWKLSVETDDVGDNLSRFLIGFDELRARLAPPRYPNLEISDEGCLWFNIGNSVEIIGIPFEFKGLKAPSLIISFPRKAEDTGISFLENLRNVAQVVEGAELFAGTSEKDETLKAYEENRNPPLTIAQNLQEILILKEKGVFFSYLGVQLNVASKTVSEIENSVKHILLRTGRMVLG